MEQTKKTDITAIDLLCGCGALFFEVYNMVKGKCFLSDMNADLVIAFNHIKTKHTKEMQKRLLAVQEGKGLYANYSDSWKKCPWNEPSCTIKENHGGVNIHPKLPRVLTVRECARIQSFPDNFIFQGTKSKQLVQIGNAVPPNLSKAVGLAILKSYEQN